MKGKEWSAAIDAACDKSAEAWTRSIRRRERAAFLRGYADAAVRRNRTSRQRGRRPRILS
jgi:hypothetical protein